MQQCTANSCCRHLAMLCFGCCRDSSIAILRSAVICLANAFQFECRLGECSRICEMHDRHLSACSSQLPPFWLHVLGIVASLHSRVTIIFLLTALKQRALSPVVSRSLFLAEIKAMDDSYCVQRQPNPMHRELPSCLHSGVVDDNRAYALSANAARQSNSDRQQQWINRN